MDKRIALLNSKIVKVKDFPERGILFSDISKLIEDSEAFKIAVNLLTDFARPLNITKVVGIEARGFIFGTPIAYNLGVGFTSVRKPNKLPRAHVTTKTTIEYGERELSIHRDSLKPGDSVLIVDDILATGGTIYAAINLVHSLKANVSGICFLGRITTLKGAEIVTNFKHKWLLEL